MKSVEIKIRKLKIPQLEILKLISGSNTGVSSSKELGNTTSTSSYRLGAMITPLRRIETKGGRLIIPAGRDMDNSVRWQINEKAITRDELKRLLNKMNV